MTRFERLVFLRSAIRRRLAVAAVVAGVAGLSWAEGEVPTGTITVAAGKTNTITDASGTITLKGGGVLIVDFERAFAAAEDVVDFVVEEGELILRNTLDRGGNVTVAEGALLKLDADNQIRDGKFVTVHGTFDLNGHSEKLTRFHNSPDNDTTFRTNATARIINTSDGPARLISTGLSCFYGRVEECPGEISIVPGGTGAGLFGPTGAAAISNVDCQYEGYLPFSLSTTLRFEFRAPAGGNNRVALSEIQLTYQGKPISAAAVKDMGDSGHESDNVARRLIDNQSSTFWRSADVGADACVWITLNSAKVDGYRLAPYDFTGAPAGWRVWAYRWTTCSYVLVDDHWDTPLADVTQFPRNYGPLFTFSAPGRLGSVFGASTVVNLTATSANAPVKNLRVSANDPFVTGPLTGAGGILLESGSILAPGALVGYTGVISADPETCNRVDTEAGVWLDAGRGGEEQRVRISTNSAHLAIGNATSEPVSVLLDDQSSAEPLHGRLTDANGPLGLVKRGAGVRTLETEDADATGPVNVEAGTLRLQGSRTLRSIKARYIRINVSKMWGDGWDDFTDTVAHSHSTGPSGMNWGMNEFELLDADGNKVSWPEGTEVKHSRDLEFSSGPLKQLIDGNIANRCLIYNDAATTTDAKSTDASGVVTIDTGTDGVTFQGYRWYTPHGNAYDSKRTPTVWTISVSDDKEKWTVVHEGEAPWVKDETDFGASTPGILRGPFVCTGASKSSGTSHVVTIPETFLVTTNRGSRAPALKAKYFRFRPFATTGGKSDTSYGWQIAELSLYRNGQVVPWSNALAWVTGADVNKNNNSKETNCVNNVKVGGTADSELERCFVTRYPSFLGINAGEEVEFDAWGFTSSAGGGASERVPTDFDFSVSADGQVWTVVSTVSNHQVIKGNYQDQGPWSVGGVFALPGLRDNRLGDEAPVTIASGATLQVAAEYERIGPLAGAGTLDLDLWSTADINAGTGNAAFSGAVTGSGTLVLSGAGTQVFDDADLTGVKTLEFAGGAFAGTARFGALKVTGDVKLEVPEELMDEGGSTTLFTYDSIDADSKAALEAATFVSSFTGRRQVEIVVGEKSAVVNVRRRGAMLLLR